jgi:Zn-dependent protease with chaperone function
MDSGEAMRDEDNGGTFTILILCLFLVPGIGWFTGSFAAAAEERGTVLILVYLAFALGAGLILLIFGSSLIAGTDRARMSLVFGPLIRLVMLLLAGSVLIQAAIFAYSIFTLEAALIQRVHVGIILAVGVGALAVCLVLVRAAFSLFRTEPTAIRGKLLSSEEAPLLIENIDTLARKLGAEKPDHIIVGLEPNFFVTAAPVSLIGSGEVYHGRTLFISLSLMRLLSREEFDSVIGHELGHFRGEDVAYSMKFAPSYARLTHALAYLTESSGGAADLGRIPATVALSLYLNRFAASERTVGRQRELLADEAGAAVGGARQLANALLKVSLFSSRWAWLTDRHVDALNQGETFTRLSENYRDSCTLDEDIVWDDVLGHLGAIVQSHPVDTHPPLVERLESLGVSLWDLRPEDCKVSDDPAISLVAGATEIDGELSTLEARWLLAIGAATLPSDWSGDEEREDDETDVARNP